MIKCKNPFTLLHVFVGEKKLPSLGFVCRDLRSTCRKDPRKYTRRHERNLIKKEASHLVELAASHTISNAIPTKIRRRRVKLPPNFNLDEFLNNRDETPDKIRNEAPIENANEEVNFDENIRRTQIDFPDEINFKAFDNTEEELFSTYDIGFCLLTDLDSDAEPEDDDDLDSELGPADEDKLDNFKQDFASWITGEDVSHASVQRLLPILRSVPALSGLPKRVATPLRTPRGATKVREVQPGYYWHNGIENSLREFEDLIIKGDKIQRSSLIELTISIDGVPLTRSSSSELEPISAAIACTKEILLIGAYHGKQEPNSWNEMLQDFVTEAIHLITHGFEIHGKIYYIRIVKLICDAPAKAAALYIKGHGGYFSCTKCVIKGGYKNNRVFFNSTTEELRTDNNFLLQIQPEHHHGTSILTDIPFFKPISHVPLDYMHLVCLGVMRKLIKIWLFGLYRLKRAQIDLLSSRLIGLRKYMACEFSRLPRSLKEVKYWKATEYINFLLYTGPIVLLGILPAHKYS